jgi:hypothetical protein
MDQQAPTPAAADKAVDTTAQPKQGWLTRQLAGFYAWRKHIKAHPLWGTGFAIVVLVLGILGNEAVGRVMQRFRGPDEFLVQMKAEQKQNFDALKTSLSELRGSVDGNGSAALRNVASAAEALRDTNARLMEQVVLARRENDTLRQAVQNATGMEGGSDFIVGEGSSWRIDPQTQIGLDSVSRTYVMVNLTSRDAETSVRKSLASGQSLAYTSADGQPCKLTLHTIQNASPGSASFSRMCGGGGA